MTYVPARLTFVVRRVVTHIPGATSSFAHDQSALGPSTQSSLLDTEASQIRYMGMVDDRTTVCISRLVWEWCKCVEYMSSPFHLTCLDGATLL